MRVLSLVLLCSLSSTALAGEQDLAVMPLLALRVPKQTATILDELLATDISKLGGGYQVLDMHDIESMLGLEKMKDAIGCNDVSCAAEIGGALGVGRLVTGSVSKLGDQLIVQLTLLDTQKGRVIRRGSASVKDDENLYRDAIEQAARDVMGLATAMQSPTKPKPRPSAPVRQGPNISPVRYVFQTTDGIRKFTVHFVGHDGYNQSCPQPVTVTTPCVMRGMALGKGQLTVLSPGIDLFSQRLNVDNEKDTLAFSVTEQASVGSIMMWTFGGLLLVTGVVLTAVGAPTGIHGMVYGGVPTALVGAGLVTGAFFLKGRVSVLYPRWRLFF